MTDDSGRGGEDRQKKQHSDGGALARRVAELEILVSKLQSPIVVCNYCNGTGYEVDKKKHRPIIDDNDRTALCRVCKGLCKVRIP